MKTLTFVLVAVLVTGWSSRAAVALDITFDDVMSFGNPLVTSLETHGYRFVGVFRTIDAPAGSDVVSNGSGVYLGQESSTAGIRVTRVDGRAFALYEFAATGLYTSPTGASPNAGQVGLVGLHTGGGILSASYGLGSLPSFARFEVPETWHHLQAVTLAADPAARGAWALDDVGVGEGEPPVLAPVPEPGTLALGLLTLGAVAGALVRRRGAAPLQRH